MKNKFYIVLASFIVLLTAVSVSADTSKSFSVTPLDPETKQTQSSYYDLKVAPNEHKVLPIRIFNGADQAVKLKLKLNNGATNDNGITDYSGNSNKNTTLKVGFSDIATVESEDVTIPAKSAIDVPVTVIMPEKQYDGQILGGIRVTSAETKAKPKTSGVESNIAYTVGVVLRETEAEIVPDMSLLDAKIEQRNSQNVISATLQNGAPVIIKKLEAKASVTKAGSKKVLYEAENSNMRMAPNSQFNYGINLVNNSFKSGKYIMTVTGKADGKAFSFTKKFTIKAKEAKEFNKNSVYVTDKSTNNTYLFLIIAALVLIIFAFIIWYIKKNKKPMVVK
ncbi:DUF916 and DUF3324 domain-containing protein [Pseudolactococcus piscium]|uniref:DUF916 and DUF3324 domain-containing protein n=1 Tax=Pseudolactococcus piscium TaxID=1364 RepID=UPI000BDE98AC|nr:DUF916 and DUF3324 domain-containing protein [Lactococcus piscium]